MKHRYYLIDSHGKEIVAEVDEHNTITATITLSIGDNYSPEEVFREAGWDLKYKEEIKPAKLHVIK